MDRRRECGARLAEKRQASANAEALQCGSLSRLSARSAWSCSGFCPQSLFIPRGRFFRALNPHRRIILQRFQSYSSLLGSVEAEAFATAPAAAPSSLPPRARVTRQAFLKDPGCPVKVSQLLSRGGAGATH